MILVVVFAGVGFSAGRLVIVLSAVRLTTGGFTAGRFVVVFSAVGLAAGRFTAGAHVSGIAGSFSIGTSAVHGSAGSSITG